MKAHGKADVEWDVPMHVDAMFEIGSITKQFDVVATIVPAYRATRVDPIATLRAE